MAGPSPRLVLNLLVLCSGLTALAGAQSAAQTRAQSQVQMQAQPQTPANSTQTPPPKDVRILFTGRLLGYLGLPEQQSANPPSIGCQSAPIENDNPTKEARFINRIRGMRDAGATVILGTGDNFAPVLIARQFSVAPDGTRRSKDMNTWDWVNSKWIPIRSETQWEHDVPIPVQTAIAAGRGFIESDNVGCFLAAAEYDAIVPGVHDFYFGPERLRYLARFLATPRTGDASKVVQMLAANLVIQTTYVKPRMRLPDVHRDLPYATKYPGLAVQNITDRATVLPWLQHIDIKSEISLHDFQLCSMSPKDPSEIVNCPYSLSFTVIPGSTPTLYRASIPTLDTLLPGNNYALCTYVPNLPQHPTYGFCVRFSVYSPFFLYPNPKPMPKSQSGQPYSDPQPYLFKKLDNGTEVAVFGIVDPSLRSYVGALNYAWENTSKKYNTEIVVLDPAEALEQQLQYFEREYVEKHCGGLQGPDLATCANGPGTFHGVKVLLAQMSPPLARQLAARLRGRFNIVISEADSEQATPNETVEIKPLPEDPAFSGKGISRQGTTNALPTFVAVPPPYFDDSINHAVLQIRQLDVSRVLTSPNVPAKQKAQGSETSNWSFDVSGTRSVDPAAGTPPLGVHQAEIYQALQRLLEPDLRSGISLADTENNMRSLALYALKMKLKADVALMQARDFYFGPPPHGVAFSSTSPNWIDGILWKGDLTTLVMVKGSILLKVLQDSARFDAQDKQALSLELMRQRGLITLGIFHDTLRDEYLVNGEVLDPNRLYSVATTDYIGVGDTGYPEINEPGFDNPRVPQEFPRTLFTISGIVCEALQKAVSPAPSYECQARIAREVYFDQLNDRPSDTGPSLTAWRRFGLWTHVPYLLHPGSHPRESRHQMILNPVELSAQDRRVWFVSHSSSISLTATDNSVSEAQRKALFSGIASPSQLQAKESHELNIAVKDRMGLLGRRVDSYFQPELSYDNAVTGQSTPPAVSNFKQNLAAGEVGLFIHRSRDYPGLGLLLSIRDESQLHRPSESVTLSDAKKTSFTFGRARTNAVFGHFGFRAQNRHSFFEGGFEVGDAMRVTAFNFTSPAGTFSCPFAATIDAQDEPACVAANSDDSPGKTPTITKQSTPSAVLGSALRYGWFSNMQLVVPLLPRLSYVFTNQFDYFYAGRGSISTDMLYRDLWSNSLSVQITRNFSVAPKFDVFFYQNQVKHNSFRQVQSSISLKYAFDWFSGSRWKTALQYTEPKQ